MIFKRVWKLPVFLHFLNQKFKLQKKPPMLFYNHLQPRGNIPKPQVELVEIYNTVANTLVAKILALESWPKMH